MVTIIIVLFLAIVLIAQVTSLLGKRKLARSSEKFASTIRINVENCGCGSNGRPVMYGSFDIPDTGDASINCRIAERLMESKFGKPYECRSHDSSDYHWAFYMQPVGKWTGNQKGEQDPIEQAKARVVEIGSLLQKPDASAYERERLIAERQALQTWLVRQGAVAEGRRLFLFSYLRAKFARGQVKTTARSA